MAFNPYKNKQTSRLGGLLISKGIISPQELKQALSYQKDNHLKLGESLVLLGFIDSKQLNKVLCRQRWIRSVVAGVMMVASPVCPVLATESKGDFQDSALIALSLDESPYTSSLFNNFGSSNIKYHSNDVYVMGFKYQTSFHSGIKVGLGNASFEQIHLEGYSKDALVPQVSLFTSQKYHKKAPVSDSKKHKKVRYDRYKNSIPAVYSLTLKGYSLFEQSEKKAQIFAFEKIEGDPYRKFELMLSVSQRF